MLRVVSAVAVTIAGRRCTADRVTGRRVFDRAIHAVVLVAEAVFLQHVLDLHRPDTGERFVFRERSPHALVIVGLDQVVVQLHQFMVVADAAVQLLVQRLSVLVRLQPFRFGLAQREDGFLQLVAQFVDVFVLLPVRLVEPVVAGFRILQAFLRFVITT